MKTFQIRNLIKFTIEQKKIIYIYNQTASRKKNCKHMYPVGYNRPHSIIKSLTHVANLDPNRKEQGGQGSSQGVDHQTTRSPTLASGYQ